ncbi:MAG TPA: hypothetical protein VKE74_10650 [Gemmataceae bacterium]|nr:hypothetical protein [Gemmataceae bacterium]
MSALRTAGAAVFACAALAAGILFATTRPADTSVAAEPAALASESPASLVVHEWGTFTSFSGSDGEPVGFSPDNTDLPDFVYYQENENSKSNRLHHDGTVSMETPVIYFYSDRAMRASVRVDFPRGWITEWYPFAASPPARSVRESRTGGQSIRWDVRLLPGETVRFTRSRDESRYYQARETDATPLQVETDASAAQRNPGLRGGAVVQREKFLFYRGVGTFPPPVALRPLGGGQVRVTNTSGGQLGGLVLVSVRDGKVGFKTLATLEVGAEAVASLVEAENGSAELAEVMVKELTAAGLYEKEARAMVKTWNSAWFGENGTRLLYLVPRARTDELLPLTVDPKPTEVVRVLVGRHDFLTPEQEAEAERQVGRVRAARAELDAAEKELSKIGRFSDQARRLAEKRLDTRAAQK